MHFFGLIRPENFMDYFLNKITAIYIYVKRLDYFFSECDLFFRDLIYYMEIVMMSEDLFFFCLPSSTSHDEFPFYYC